MDNYNEITKYITCFSGIVESNKLCVFNNRCALLMTYDLEDFSYEILSEFKVVRENKCVVIKMIKKEDIIYLILQKQKCVLTYNLETNEIGVFGDLYDKAKEKQNVLNAFLYDRNIWIFPVYVKQPICFFNIQTKKWKEHRSIYNYFKAQNIYLDPDYFIDTIYQIENKIWSAVWNTPYVFFIDLDTMEIHIYDTYCGPISSFSCDRKNFWLAVSGEENIINWAPQSGVCKKYTIDGINLDKESRQFWYICDTEQRIYMIPSSNNDIYAVEKGNGNVCALGLSGNYCRIKKNLSSQLFGLCLRYKDKLILLPYSIDRFVIVNLKDASLDFYVGKLQQDDYEQYYLMELFNAGKKMEETEYKLNDFIGLIKRQNSTHDKCERWKKRIAPLIYAGRGNGY